MTDTIKDAIDSLWVDCCDASRPTDVSDDGIELYNIEGMDDAAYDGPDDNGAYSLRERAALAAIKEPQP